MNKNIKNYLAVGASSGIGRVFVERKIQEGHKVAVLGRDPRGLALTSKSRFFEIDLLKSSIVSSIANEALVWLDSLDYILFSQRARETNSENENEFRVSVEATCQIMDLSLPYFNREGSPAVVVISSVSSKFILPETNLRYHISKASLDNLTRWYAVKWGKLKIRVNAIAPGAVIKPSNEKWHKENSTLAKKKSMLIPRNKIPTASEISNVIDFLFSAKSSIFNGQVIVTDAGMSLIGHESIYPDLK